MYRIKNTVTGHLLTAQRFRLLAKACGMANWLNERAGREQFVVVRRRRGGEVAGKDSGTGRLGVGAGREDAAGAAGMMPQG